MIGEEIGLEEFFESLSNEELMNLMEKIREELRKRWEIKRKLWSYLERGGERYIHRIYISFLNRFTVSYLLWIYPHK